MSDEQTAKGLVLTINACTVDQWDDVDQRDYDQILAALDTARQEGREACAALLESGQAAIGSDPTRNYEGEEIANFWLRRWAAKIRQGGGAWQDREHRHAAVLSAATVPVWTHDPPTEPGEYWFRSDAVTPLTVSVWRDEENALTVRIGVNELYLSDLDAFDEFEESQWARVVMPMELP